ncbi:MAG TPA: DUF4157 domain-containing protein [Terracidiphilus sp.]|nr:DUF4157 domain-containing protein [Terracidiphilus sp.]
MAARSSVSPPTRSRTAGAKAAPDRPAPSAAQRAPAAPGLLPEAPSAIPAGPLPLPPAPLPPLALQRKLAIGSSDDPLEAEADRAAAQAMSASRPGQAPSAPAPALRRKSADEPGAVAAPPVVHRVLASPGQPLEPAVRADMEPRFQADFSRVRVHTDALAATSATAVNALAYTVGTNLVFSSGQYQPGSSSGRMLLAHELAHVTQQGSAPMPWVQRQGPTVTTPTPRKDYVFIMGKDPSGTGNPFYTQAANYFHAHLPAATFVDDKRSLDDMLSWISANVKDKIGNLYIVSHGNEDGTLGFSLNSSGTGHMTVNELRDALHPAGGGSTSLTSVSSVVDAQTMIHIKGCDIGRTTEMVELIDEAFGGAGTVTAPTHEQEYTPDAKLGTDARKAAHDTDIAAFTAKQPAIPPAPAPVDPKLKGDDLKKAKKAHDDAVAARKAAQDAQKQAIAAEETRIKPELDEVENKAKIVDALSGPMFQRPGNKLFTTAELQPDIDRLYPHLSLKQRQDLATRLVARDPGRAGDQQGQMVDRSPVASDTFNDPQTLAEGKILYGKAMSDGDFTPDAMSTKKTTGPAGTTIDITFTGTFHHKGADPFDGSWTGISSTVPDSTKLIALAKTRVNNPDRYQWQVETKHSTSTGVTTLNAFGERVKAYLHHGSLDAAPHEHFSEPESNPDFYYTSKFAPPPPPPPATGTSSPASGATKP